MIKAKKILFLGEISPGQTSHMRMQAFQRLGYDVCGVNTNAPWMRVPWLVRRLQRSLQQGSVVNEINQAAIAAARDFHPDLIWAEKQEFLSIETIEALRELKARLIHFTPDPYFSLEWKRTRLMDRAMGAFDVLIYCKRYEQQDYEALGKPSIYMPLGYCDRVHRPLSSDNQKWSCDVGFLGGWEPRRETFLHAVAATDTDLKIWGGYWDFLRDGKWSLRRQIILSQLAGEDRWRFHKDPLLANAYQGGEVYEDDYARALSGSKIGLGFLRQVCPDQHTTRTFEIPACGSMLLADRTDEHQEFFEEGKEAEFFDSLEELVDKVRYYSRNESERVRVADAGHHRCINSRYAYTHRLADVLHQIEEGKISSAKSS
jgi:spore maturation protein CgeB